MTVLWPRTKAHFVCDKHTDYTYRSCPRQTTFNKITDKDLLAQIEFCACRPHVPTFGATSFAKTPKLLFFRKSKSADFTHSIYTKSTPILSRKTFSFLAVLVVL
jgi:hypothetical protein